MKKFIPLLVLLAACTNTTPKQQAEKSVHDYMATAMNDPASYQLVSLSIDTPKVLFSETPAGKQLIERRDSLEVETLVLDPKGQRMNVVFDSIKLLQQAGKKQVVDTSHGQWVGLHAYRAKNAFGALMLATDTVFFDRNFKIVDYRKEQVLK